MKRESETNMIESGHGVPLCNSCGEKVGVNVNLHLHGRLLLIMRLRREGNYACGACCASYDGSSCTCSLHHNAHVYSFHGWQSFNSDSLKAKCKCDWSMYSERKRAGYKHHKIKAGAENALYVYIPSITNDSFGNLNISIILEWLELYRLGCLQFSQMLPICSTLTVIIKLIIIRHTCMVYFSWS